MASSSSSAAPWEDRAHPWEDPDYNADPDSDIEPLDEKELATQAFLDDVIDLYLQSKISAKNVCELCWHANKGGVGGMVAEYAAKPGQSSGNYQRHLDK
eukprot:7864217-Alexandrium_andersonii.AAC.1